MKQSLSDELKKIFNLNKEDNLITLVKDRRVRSISGLSSLITSLNDSTVSPKTIAQQLEDVIVCISIKDKDATELETSLKIILEAFQDTLITGEIELQDEVSSLTFRR